MQIVSSGDNLQEMPNPVFLENLAEQNRTEQNFIINTQVYADIWGYEQVYYIETWWHIHLHAN